MTPQLALFFSLLLFFLFGSGVTTALTLSVRAEYQRRGCLDLDQVALTGMFFVLTVASGLFALANW